jgi:hypothetical protein
MKTVKRNEKELFTSHSSIYVPVDDTIPLPHVELLGLLATGNLNPAIHEYLSAGLTPNVSEKQHKRPMICVNASMILLS